MKPLTHIGLPVIHSRSPDHAIDMEEKKYEQEERHWRSCCWYLNRDSTVFFSKLFISTCVVGLCIYQLIMVADCGSQHMYSGLLGIILGAYLK